MYYSFCFFIYILFFSQTQNKLKPNANQTQLKRNSNQASDTAFPMMYCCICSKKISGYGHNAEPLSQGECCDTCNVKVISARLKHSESAELEDLKQRIKANTRYTRGKFKLADSLHEIDLRGRN